MELIKFREIQKSVRALRNNISYNSVITLLDKYKKDLDLNPDKIDVLVKNILAIDFHNKPITLQKLNLKYKKTSKEYWIIRGWDTDYAINMSKKSNEIYSYNLRLNKKGYSDSQIKEIVSKSCKAGLDSLKKRSDYDSIIKKRNIGLTKDRYLNIINPDTGVNYTCSEANIKYLEHQRNAGSLSCKNRTSESFNTRIEFYINKGMSIDDAESALFERQVRNGLNYYINKYGLKNGTKKYEIRIKKYGEKIKKLRKEYPERWKIANGKNYSDSSKRFFDSIISEIEELRNMSIFYANNEYFIYDKTNKKIYFYDFYIKQLNLIIEYHGIIWHPRERIQKGWLHPYTKETSERFYDNDRLKEKLANDNNIDVITIFENEIIDKRQDIIYELHKRINSYHNNK